MKRLIAIAVLIVAIPFFAGCIIVEKPKPAKETEVIIVPEQKKVKKHKHKHKEVKKHKHKKGKAVMCYKGKAKWVKKKDIQKYLDKGAYLGSCK